MLRMWALLGISVIALCASADDAPSIAKWIADLGAENPAVREPAFAELLRVGDRAVPALEQAIERSTSALQKGQAQRLLGLHVPGGNEVHGLSLRLALDAREYEKRGEGVPLVQPKDFEKRCRIRFVLTVRNSAKHPRHLQAAGLYPSKHVVEGGDVFCVLNPQQGEQAAHKSAAAMAICGVNPPTVVTIPAEGELELVCEARVSEQRVMVRTDDGGRACLTAYQLEFGAEGHMELGLLEPGIQRLRATWHVSSATLPGEPQALPPIEATLRSPVVELRLP